MSAAVNAVSILSAESELFELENLSVGCVAPDIVGKDLDGREFRLSEYRGKVVMLDFWGHWCPPCRQMYPHEQHIVDKLNGLPFALVGFSFLIYGFFIEPDQLVLKEEEIRINGWNKAFDGLRIVVMSDIHGGSAFITEDKLKSIVELANSQNGDLIVLRSG